MKKVILVSLVILLVVTLSGCFSSWRENLLAPPDEIQVPDDAIVATCIAEDTFVYVYRGDVIYLYYVNDILQSEAEVHMLQEPVAILESMQLYLDETFLTGSCTYGPYIDNDQ